MVNDALRHSRSIACSLITSSRLRMVANNSTLPTVNAYAVRIT